MIRDVANYVVPVAAVIFVGYRLRGTVLLLCAVPVVLSMGEAVFVRTWTRSFALPLLPLSLNWTDVVFITLIAAWLYARERHPRYRRLVPGPDIIAVILIVSVIVLEIPLGWALDGAVKPGVLWAMRGWLYIPICLAIWADVFRRSSRNDVHRLFATLALVSVPLALMYSLSSVGVHVYPYLGWAGRAVGSATVVRDFLTFPLWLKLGLAWYLTRPKQSVASLLAIGVLLAACVLTYTRSIEVAAAVAVFAAVALPLTEARSWGKAGRRVAAFVCIAAVSVLGLMAVVPGNFAYSAQRLVEFVQMGTGDPNASYRVEMFSAAGQAASGVNGIFGLAGSSVGEADMAALSERGLLVGDSLWPYVVSGLGFAGVASFAFLFGVFLWRAARRALQAHGVSRLASVLLIVMLWDIIRSLASSEFVTLYPVVSVLFMALLVVEIRGAWRKAPPVAGA